MSTRATYTIKENESVNSFYIHHDGYPSYAYNYFKNMIDFESNIEPLYKSKGGYAERFLRANSGAMFTSRPSNHSDREYHYDYAKS